MKSQKPKKTHPAIDFQDTAAAAAAALSRGRGCSPPFPVSPPGFLTVFWGTYIIQDLQVKKNIRHQHVMSCNVAGSMFIFLGVVLSVIHQSHKIGSGFCREIQETRGSHCHS